MCLFQVFQFCYLRHESDDLSRLRVPSASRTCMSCALPLAVFLSSNVLSLFATEAPDQHSRSWPAPLIERFPIMKPPTSVWILLPLLSAAAVRAQLDGDAGKETRWAMPMPVCQSVGVSRPCTHPIRSPTTSPSAYPTPWPCPAGLPATAPSETSQTEAPVTEDAPRTTAASSPSTSELPSASPSPSPRSADLPSSPPRSAGSTSSKGSDGSCPPYFDTKKYKTTNFTDCLNTTVAISPKRPRADLVTGAWIQGR